MLSWYFSKHAQTKRLHSNIIELLVRNGGWSLLCMARLPSQQTPFSSLIIAEIFTLQDIDDLWSLGSLYCNMFVCPSIDVNIWQTSKLLHLQKQQHMAMMTRMRQVLKFYIVFLVVNWISNYRSRSVSLNWDICLLVNWCKGSEGVRMPMFSWLAKGPLW